MQNRLMISCWSLLAIHFLSSGILRGLIFPDLSNYIYFAPLPILLTLVVMALRVDSKISYLHFFCFMLSVTLAFYQLILVAVGSINLQTAFYGWFLYGLPLLGLDAAKKSLNLHVIFRIIAIFEFFLVPNLILSLLQTVIRDSRFYSAGFGEGLQSAFGVQRATGTFSSPAGYALYLTLISSLLVIRNIFRKFSLRRDLISYSLLAIQIPMSGSRTAIISVLLVVIAVLVFNQRIQSSSLSKVSTKTGLNIIVFVVLLVTIFIIFQNAETFKATSTRFVDANRLDPPISRLLSQISLNFEGIQFLYGTGLGSRANATTEVGVDWIEFDAQRIIVESGLILGSILLLTRLGLALRFSRSFFGRKFAAEIPLTVCIVPVLLFSQFMGQGSLSAGTWLGIYILEYIRKLESIPL